MLWPRPIWEKQEENKLPEETPIAEMKVDKIEPYVIYEEVLQGLLKGTKARAVFSARKISEPAKDGKFQTEYWEPLLFVEIAERDALGKESWREVQGEVYRHIAGRIAMFHHNSGPVKAVVHSGHCCSSAPMKAYLPPGVQGR